MGDLRAARMMAIAGGQLPEGIAGGLLGGDCPASEVAGRSVGSI